MSDSHTPDGSTETPSAGDDGDPLDMTKSIDSTTLSDEKVDLSPEKREMYQAIRSDVDVTEAFLEFVDNIIDHWEKVSSKRDQVKIDIFTRKSENGEFEVVIRDDAGGVSPDNLAMMFAVGKSAKDDIDGSVGAYGVGMKKAILRLADEATIATRETSAANGYGFTVDKGWLSTDSWELPVEKFDVDPGVTEIRLRNLNFQASELKQRLKSPLETTYEIYLGGGPRPDVQNYDFEIRVENEMLNAGSEVNWAYPPFDDLHPRQFRNKQFNSADISEPVLVHVTVGVLQTADADESGTDVFIQNRKVHDGAKDEQGGYGLTRYMDKFDDSRHKRLKIIVEIETDGDAAQLPWSSSKNTIDLDHSLSDQIFNWVSRVSQGYYKSNYDAVPQTVLRPYDNSCTHSHAGEIGKNHRDVAATGREKITHKVRPTAGISKGEPSFPRSNQIASTAEAHAQLGIKVPDAVRDKFVPAYEEHWKTKFDSDYFDDVKVHPVTLGADPDIDLSKFEEKLEQIDKWARTDAGNNKRYVDLEAWQEPRYMATLRQYLNETTDEDDLTEITERPTPPGPSISKNDDQVDDDTSSDDESLDPSGSDLTEGAESEAVIVDSDAGVDDNDTVSGVDDPDVDREVRTVNDPENDRTEHLIRITDDQMTTLNDVLDLSDDFDECSPTERGDEIAQKCERLRTVFHAASEAMASGD